MSMPVVLYQFDGKAQFEIPLCLYFGMKLV